QYRQYHDQQEGGDLDNQRQQQDLRLRRPQPAHHGQRQRLRRGGRCERELQPRSGRDRRRQPLPHHGDPERHGGGSTGQLRHHQRRGRLHHQQEGGDLDDQ